MAGLEIRDPIHGLISREEQEQQIIDTPLFQRLRRIKQLALASLVYPGAVHTRFDHSLGVLHVASRIATRLGFSESDVRLVRLAALLHDIGHGPFSHVSEDVFKGLAQSGTLTSRPKQQIHEVISERIIKSYPGFSPALNDTDRRRICDLLAGNYGDPVFREIISGPLDADKQDYLLRDAYFCGVKYGVYDIERLAHSLSARGEAPDRYLAVSRDDVHVLEQFIMAWYYMNTQVYRHRIRLITDSMIVRGIILGIEHDGIDWLRRLYSYDGSDAYLQEYLAWDDERLMTAILALHGGLAWDMFTRLRERRLLKCIARLGPDDFVDEPPEIRAQLTEPSRAILAGLDACIAQRYGFPKEFVIVRLNKFDPITARASDITIRGPQGDRFLREASTLFRSINEATNRDYALDVYVPMQYRDDPHDKKEQLARFHNEIRALVVQAARQAQPTPPAQEGQP